jgi:hypothetical protein
MNRKLIIIVILSLCFFISSSFAGEVTSFGPNKYLRTTGKPNVYSGTFPGIAGQGKLILKNGTRDGENRISSALIRVNGQQVLGPSDFNQRVYNKEVPINIAQNNSISVELMSKPNSYLTLQITQEIGMISDETFVIRDLMIDPLWIRLNTPTLVTISVKIDDLTLVPNSVCLLRFDGANGIRFLDNLRDDGLNGDVLAGDRIYTLQRIFSEQTIGEVPLLITVKFNGQANRVVSDLIPLYAISDPQDAIAATDSFLQEVFDGNPLRDQNDDPHRPVVVPNVPTYILEAFQEIAPTSGGAVLKFGSLNLTGFLTGNTSAKEGAYSLVDSLQDNSIRTDDLNAILQNTDFHREGFEAGGIYICGQAGAITFFPGISLEVNSTCDIRNSAVVFDGDVHVVLHEADINNLIARHFVNDQGLPLSSTDTIVHELLHVVDYRTNCFSGADDEYFAQWTTAAIIDKLVIEQRRRLGLDISWYINQYNDDIQRSLQQGGAACLERLGLTPIQPPPPTPPGSITINFDNLGEGGYPGNIFENQGVLIEFMDLTCDPPCIGSGFCVDDVSGAPEQDIATLLNVISRGYVPGPSASFGCNYGYRINFIHSVDFVSVLSIAYGIGPMTMIAYDSNARTLAEDSFFVNEMLPAVLETLTISSPGIYRVDLIVHNPAPSPVGVCADFDNLIFHRP